MECVELNEWEPKLACLWRRYDAHGRLCYVAY